MARNKYLLTINSYFQTRNNTINRIQMRYILYINIYINIILFLFSFASQLKKQH